MKSEWTYTEDLHERSGVSHFGPRPKVVQRIDIAQKGVAEDEVYEKRPSSGSVHPVNSLGLTNTGVVRGIRESALAKNLTVVGDGCRSCHVNGMHRIRVRAKDHGDVDTSVARNVVVACTVELSARDGSVHGINVGRRSSG